MKRISLNSDVGGGAGVGGVCLPSYPHAKFDVLASVHLHAWVQKTDLAKVFPINHKGAADHRRSSE